MASGHVGSQSPKQFLELGGIPVLIHTLRAFAAVPAVTQMFVAVRAGEMERVTAQVQEYGLADKVRVVTGGDSRQESVAHALAAVREDFPQLAISGVIEPGARAAVEAAGGLEHPVIGIMGTEGTIRSGAYERAIGRFCPGVRLVCHATPLLAPIIEEGRSSEDPLVELALGQYLRPFIDRGVQVLVLGCTHYPVYKDLIARMVGPRVAVIDSADKCAEDVGRRLRAAGLDRGARAESGYLRCFVTDNSPRFGSLAYRFLGLKIDPPTLVPTDDLHEQGERALTHAPTDRGSVAERGALCPGLQ